MGAAEVGYDRQMMRKVPLSVELKTEFMPWVHRPVFLRSVREHATFNDIPARNEVALREKKLSPQPILEELLFLRGKAVMKLRVRNFPQFPFFTQQLRKSPDRRHL